MKTSKLVSVAINALVNSNGEPGSVYNRFSVVNLHGDDSATARNLRNRHEVFVSYCPLKLLGVVLEASRTGKVRLYKVTLYKDLDSTTKVRSLIRTR